MAVLRHADLLVTELGQQGI